MLLSTVVLWASTINGPEWLSTQNGKILHEFLQKVLVSETAYAAWFWSACVLTVLWLLAAALPLILDYASQDGHAVVEIRHRAFYYNTSTIMSQTLFLPIVINLLKPIWCDYRTSAPGVLFAAPNRSCWAHEQVPMALVGMIALLTFVFTTTHLRGARASTSPKTPRSHDNFDSPAVALNDSGLDGEFSASFTAVTNHLYLGLVCICLFQPFTPNVLFPTIIVLAALVVAWNSSYSWLLETRSCSVPVFSVLRWFGSAIVLHIAVCVTLEYHSPTLFAVGTIREFVSVLGLGAAVLASIMIPSCIFINRSALKLYRQQLAASFQNEALAELHNLDLSLRGSHCVRPSGSDYLLSARQLARRLEKFERSIPVEYYDQHFFRGRRDWCLKVAAISDFDFTSLKSLTSELQGGIRRPSQFSELLATLIQHPTLARIPRRILSYILTLAKPECQIAERMIGHYLHTMVRVDGRSTRSVDALFRKAERCVAAFRYDVIGILQLNSHDLGGDSNPISSTFYNAYNHYPNDQGRLIASLSSRPASLHTRLLTIAEHVAIDRKKCDSTSL
jgi:hypothetical protein